MERVKGPKNDERHGGRKEECEKDEVNALSGEPLSGK